MIATHFPWLTAITLLPVVAALPIPLIPAKSVRWYATGVGVITFLLMGWTFWQHYDLGTTALQLEDVYPWVPQFGLNWSVGVDGLSMPLVLLSGLVTTLGMVAGWNVENKPRLFYFLMLLLYGAQVGVFAAQDMILFFLMWEIELVPVYLLISIWGGSNRQYAATKFILYTAIGSIFILVAALGMAFSGDFITFDMATLATKTYDHRFSLLIYAALLIAFGVKLPIFPLHTWLPDAHSEASAPVSMILAGVLLKMAGYGLMRMNMEMLPDAHVVFAPVLVTLGVINIIYAALAALGQAHLKRRLAYSSIAHMGFVLVGLGSLTELGTSGALLQMISHGLIAAVLFFLSGVTYERTHTLVMEKLGGMAEPMPKVFALFTAASLASLALPGMSGFVGELTIFLGITASDAYSNAFKVVVVILAAVGVILTPIYLLSMLRQVFFGQNTSGIVIEKFLGDLKPRELAVSLCLIVPIIGIGFYPRLATQTYDLKTVAVVADVRNVLPTVIAQQSRPDWNDAVVVAANPQS